MKDYEIIIRLQDPAFDKVVKMAIPSTRENAQKVWKLKEKKESITLTHEGREYLLSPGDILQIRQTGCKKSGTDGKGYKRTMIGTWKAAKDEDGVYKRFIVFEICRTRKLHEGWGDSEYEEVYKILDEEWIKLSEEDQNQLFWDLERKHFLK